MDVTAPQADPTTADPEARAVRRLVEACEEVRSAARSLGLNPEAIGELYAPLHLRVDAFLHRSSQLLDAGDCPRCRRLAARPFGRGQHESRLLLKPTWQRRQRQRRRWEE